MSATRPRESDLSSREDPHHPIVDRPWEYEIAELHFRAADEESAGPSVDLVLRRGATVRRLRFLGVRDLELESGFPQPTHGMCILDVRGRGLEGIGVRLADFEVSPGRVRLWARDVIDLDAT